MRSLETPLPLFDLFEDKAGISAWVIRWEQRRSSEGRPAEEISRGMNRVNPIYIPRNHKVEEALDASEAGDYHLVEELLDVLKDPYEERAGLEAYGTPAPQDFGPYQTFCGT
jgi:uncharacterized protein YdiU (UPF0061 family)